MNIHKGYRIFLALICLSLTLALTIGNAQASGTRSVETDFAAIDAYVTEQMTNLDIPGMALGIVQDGQIMHLQGFGVADSSGRAVTPQTPFYIGSVTKSFTALAVMQLVETDKINLDASVQTYLPWFELADKEASAKITVRNLLNQNSGISTRDGMRFWTSQQSLEEIVRGLNKIQLTQPVGSTFQYSNLNYMIVGLIVEKVSEQPYVDYITEHIFKPLDMRHSYTSRESALTDGLAEGHLYMFGHLFSNEGVMPLGYFPSTWLIASVEDMTHFAIAQLNDGQYGDASLLSPQGMLEMHTAIDSPYAMGWNVGTIDDVQGLQHNGDAGRNHSLISLIPAHGFGLVLLANASGYEQMWQVEPIAFGIFNMLSGKPAAPVSVPFMTHFLYWSLLLTPFLQILGIIFVWRKQQSMKVWGVLVTVILNLGMVFLILSLSQSSMPLLSMVAFFPEIGIVSITVATFGIGWSVIYTAMYLMRRRSQ